MNPLDPSWKNLLPGPKLGIHISDTLEVGFGRYGSSLGLSGTFSAKSHFIFVQNVSVDLFHRKHQTVRRLNWFAFRPHQFSYQGMSETDFQMPEKFMVTSQEARPYNILFIDEYNYAELKPLLHDIKQEWELWIRKTSPAGLIQNLIKQPIENFRDFLLHHKALQYMEKLIKLSCWDQGEYAITLKATTENPSRMVEMRKKFVLTERDVNDLQNNAQMIVRDVCGQPGIMYQTFNLKLI